MSKLSPPRSAGFTLVVLLLVLGATNLSAGKLGPVQKFSGTSNARASNSLPAQGRQRRPNIILIVADNLGYGVLGSYGQKRILTPDLDRMAGQGIRFTHAYCGGTVCTPSRCALMTGMHTGHNRLRGNKALWTNRFRGKEVSLEPEDITIAEILQQTGYKTGGFGKWGLGGTGTTGHPNDQGFDVWFGYLDQLHAHSFYPHHVWDNRQEIFLLRNLGGRKEEFSHDLFTERGLSFIERNRDGPFFLWMAYVLPALDNELWRHTGIGVEVPEYGTYQDKPWPGFARGFAAMVTRLDRDVGRIMALLKELGIDEDTIVFFCSDNGPLREAGHDPDFFDDNGPFRGVIRDMYEGGLRIPMLVRWPGRIKPGQVSDYAWALWDFLPTAAEIAGVSPPSGLDGVSILPLLLGKPQQDREFLYWESHERGSFAQAVRMGVWKGIRLGGFGQPIELYNLKEDEGEQVDVSSQYPAIVKKIADIMKNARTDSALFPI